MITQQAIERFWSKVDKRGDSECWLWHGAQNSHGYGHLTYQQRNYPAHRFAYLITHGCIPEGYFICHRCDVRNCVNPAHLFLGTSADNLHDMWNKGRGKHQVYPGNANPKAKLTDEQVMEIRQSDAKGMTGKQVLADRYGVCLGTIYTILSNKGWKHI